VISVLLSVNFDPTAV